MGAGYDGCDELFCITGTPMELAMAAMVACVCVSCVAAKAYRCKLNVKGKGLKPVGLLNFQVREGKGLETQAGAFLSNWINLCIAPPPWRAGTPRRACAPPPCSGTS
jgi:hypothetical protein